MDVSDHNDIGSKLDALKLNKKKELNILLFGETGAGKSTFINSIFMYLQFGDFKVAEKEPTFNPLIPASFIIEDKNGDMKTVKVGQCDDTNENLKSGASATQAVKIYSFCLKSGVKVRLIDTPGMGDTKGIHADEKNCENILSYINRVDQLHAICYLTKSQQSRSTVYFKYCVSQILSRLEKSAGKNIIFLFTHSKGSNYTAGDTLQLVRDLTEEIRKNPAHAEIPLDRNAFCFDNEAFRALAAIKNGVELSPQVRRWSIESWKRSEEQCWKMINYIQELPPHFVHNTLAINEARRVIYQLSQPMADIVQLVHDNIQILKRREDELTLDETSLGEMKKKLYIPVIDLVVTKLSQPVTVCTHSSCTEIYAVGDGKQENHFKTRCHDPCFLNNVPRDLIGSPELINCSCMKSNQNCSICDHNYRVHMHVYYFTAKKQIEKEDEFVSKIIDTKKLAIENAQRVIANIQQRKLLLERELNVIIKCNAKFAYFLSNNAIAPYSDHYEEYIQYLLTKERGLKSNSDQNKVNNLQRLLLEHTEMKKLFADAATMNKKIGQNDGVNPQDISKTMTELFNLDLNGKKIKEMFDSQKKTLNLEYTYSEYLHKGVFETPAPGTKEGQEKKKKDKKPLDKKKGPSSAANPTTKFQRGRPNNRNDKVQPGNRGRSAGSLSAPNRNSPPPPYDFENYYRHDIPPPNFPLNNRGAAPPPLGNWSRFDQLPTSPPPPPPQLKFAQAAGTAQPDVNGPTIQVQLTLPRQSPGNENTGAQVSASYARPDTVDRGYYDHGSRGPPSYHQPPYNRYFPENPSGSPRDLHPPMDGYPLSDSRAYPPRGDYYPPPRQAYPCDNFARDRSFSSDPYYSGPGYPPQQYPRNNHPSQWQYPNSSNNHRGGQRRYGQTRNENTRQGNQDNYRGGNNNQTNVLRPYKKKNKKANKEGSNSNDDSDTSVASANK